MSGVVGGGVFGVFGWGLKGDDEDEEEEVVVV